MGKNLTIAVAVLVACVIAATLGTEADRRAIVSTSPAGVDVGAPLTDSNLDFGAIETESIAPAVRENHADAAPSREAPAPGTNTPAAPTPATTPSASPTPASPTPASPTPAGPAPASPTPTTPPATTPPTTAPGRAVAGSSGFCASPAGLPYRGDILPYLRSSTDVVVPPGRYSIGAANSLGKSHRVDENRSRWVTVKAEVPGTVVVDGSINNSAVTFSGQGLGSSRRSQKIIVAGIHFTATSVKFSSTQDISFWYTCHEYSPKQWHENAMASAAANGVTVPATGPKDPHGDGGGLYALNANSSAWNTIAAGMGAFLPTGLRSMTPVGASQDLHFFGVDIGPVADDGVFMTGTWDFVMQGARIHSVSELYWQPNGDGISVDPGPVYGDQADQFHNDGIQLGAAGWRPTFVDSWSEGRVMFNTAHHPAKPGWDIRIRRAWFGPDPAVRTGGSHQVARLTDDAKFNDWLQGNSGGPYPSSPVAVIATTTARLAGVSGELTNIKHITSTPTNPFATIINGNFTSTAALTNLTINNITNTNLGLGYRDVFTSHDTIAQHPQNPANIWRTAHPYNQLDTFTGLTTPGYRPN